MSVVISMSVILIWHCRCSTKIMWSSVNDAIGSRLAEPMAAREGGEGPRASQLPGREQRRTAGMLFVLIRNALSVDNAALFNMQGARTEPAF